MAPAAIAQSAQSAQSAAGTPAADTPDVVRTLVERLDLDRYKATIKGLTQFGDRREGTDRNRAAIDWIEQQLRSYGCATERMQYVHEPAPRPAPAANTGRGATPAGP